MVQAAVGGGAGNQIGDAGTQALAEVLRRNSTVEILDLESTNGDGQRMPEVKEEVGAGRGV